LAFERGYRRARRFALVHMTGDLWVLPQCCPSLVFCLSFRLSCVVSCVVSWQSQVCCSGCHALVGGAVLLCHAVLYIRCVSHTIFPVLVWIHLSTTTLYRSLCVCVYHHIPSIAVCAHSHALTRTSPPLPRADAVSGRQLSLAARAAPTHPVPRTCTGLWTEVERPNCSVAAACPWVSP